MRVIPKIDWLTMSRPYSFNVDEIAMSQTMADNLAVKIYESSKVLSNEGLTRIERKEPFYQFHYSNRENQQLSISESQLQGVRLVLSGQSLPVGQTDQRKLYEGLRDEYWRVTRCDIAIDFLDGDQEIITLWTEHIEKQALQRRNKSQLILGASGDTINIGSRTSDKYLRIYDKGREQKSELNWKRFELEIKHKTAHSLPGIYNVLLKRASATISGMLSSLPDNYRKAIDTIGDDWEALVRPVPATRGNKELWLFEQVLPSIKKLRDEDRELYDRFVQAVIETKN